MNSAEPHNKSACINKMSFSSRITDMKDDFVNNNSLIILDRKISWWILVK